MREGGSRKLSLFAIPKLIPNGPAAAVGLVLGARAGVHAPVSVCASGAEAIALGFDLLRADRADVVVCGGAEASLLPLLRALGAAADSVPVSATKSMTGHLLGASGALEAVITWTSTSSAGRRAHCAPARRCRVPAGSAVTTSASPAGW